jgi:hypothetical protein
MSGASGISVIYSVFEDTRYPAVYASERSPAKIEGTIIRRFK